VFKSLTYFAFFLDATITFAQSDLPTCSGKYTSSWNNCHGGHDVTGLGQYFCERKDGYCNGQEKAITKKAQSDLERDRLRTEAIKDRNAQLAAERQEIAQENAVMAEEARRQTVLQYYMHSLPTYQPLPMPKAPTMTNCNAYGNQINCITR